MKRIRKGFTLTEMITVVVILMVLFAIFTPGLIAIRNNLIQRELDDTAREIYVAAQNSLTARKAAGTAKTLSLGEGQRDTDSNDCWLYQDDPGREDLLPEGTIEGTVAGHVFAVNYNEESGVVIEVYYSEKTDLRSAAANGTALAGKYGGEDHKKDRRDAGIGYYSAGETENIKIDTIPEPKVELLNSDDERDALILRVSFDGKLPSNTHMKITIVNQDNEEESALFYEPLSCNTDFISNSHDWVLDSLETGKHWSDMVPGITPGANVQVYVEVSAPPDGETTYKSINNRNYPAQGNSLFASLDGTTASVASPRHLQNLSSSVSGVNKEAVTVTAAIQTAKNIDWSKAGKAFIPIDSPVADSRSVLCSYDGRGNEIRNLTVEGEGLFQSMTGSAAAKVART